MPGLPDVRLPGTATAFAGGLRSGKFLPIHARSRAAVGVRSRWLGRQRGIVRPCFRASVCHGHEQGGFVFFLSLQGNRFGLILLA